MTTGTSKTNILASPPPRTHSLGALSSALASTSTAAVAVPSGVVAANDDSVASTRCNSNLLEEQHRTKPDDDADVGGVERGHERGEEAASVPALPTPSSAEARPSLAHYGSTSTSAASGSSSSSMSVPLLEQAQSHYSRVASTPSLPDAAASVSPPLAASTAALELDPAATSHEQEQQRIIAPFKTHAAASAVPIIQFDPATAGSDDDDDEDDDAGVAGRPRKRKSTSNLRGAAAASSSSKAGGEESTELVRKGSDEGANSRRKITIEYIEKKDKRHITFTKRKAGIMKKAYELATLTGTQVLLLVVSETGLVYTFTTAKFQPLVGAAEDDTLGEGQKLIQACLSAKDGEKPDFAAVRSGDPASSEPLPLPASASRPFEVNSAIHGGQISLKARLGSRPTPARRSSAKSRPPALRSTSASAVPRSAGLIDPSTLPPLPSPLSQPSESPVYLDPSLASPVSPNGHYAQHPAHHQHQHPHHLYHHQQQEHAYHYAQQHRHPQQQPLPSPDEYAHSYEMQPAMYTPSSAGGYPVQPTTLHGYNAQMQHYHAAPIPRQQTATPVSGSSPHRPMSQAAMLPPQQPRSAYSINGGDNELQMQQQAAYMQQHPHVHDADPSRAYHLPIAHSAER